MASRLSGSLDAHCIAWREGVCGGGGRGLVVFGFVRLVDWFVQLAYSCIVRGLHLLKFYTVIQF